MTEAQQILLDVRGSGGPPELVVNVWRGQRQPGVPSHYKIDIANPEKMIAIQMDGRSQNSWLARERDAHKDAIRGCPIFCVCLVWSMLHRKEACMTISREILDELLKGVERPGGFSAMPD